MADSGYRGTVAVLTVCLVLLTVAFTAVSVTQIYWTRQLQQRYQESELSLNLLQASCDLVDTPSEQVIQQSSDEPNDGDGYAAEFESLSQRAAGLDEPRTKRATTHTLQQLVMDMMTIQEKILLDHCINNTKLCDSGPKGPQGLQGSAGPDGTRGLQGQTGLAGPKGDPGIQGSNGTKGDRGPQGVNGTAGGPGARGLKGSKGDQGIQGNNGTAGVAGLKGETGGRGIKGNTGPPGVMGVNGTDGVQGVKGDQGAQGLKGARGTRGPPGPDGVDLKKDCLCTKPPIIDNFAPQTSTLVSPLGSVVNLKCDSSNASSPTTVTWTRSNPAHCAFNVTGPILSIAPLQPGDLGRYTCTVTNAFGSASKTFTIQSTNTSHALDCDFETQDTCLWQQSAKDDADWMIMTGNTPTTGTGPSSDHTLGNSKGNYLYVEGSIGAAGDQAKLRSPELPVSGEACLSFWYNMYGANVGKLRVQAEMSCSHGYSTLVTLPGNQGRAWHRLVLQVPAMREPHRMSITSVQGNGVLSDIAIDDLVYTAGKCPSDLSIVGKNDVNVDVSVSSQLVLDCNATGSSTPHYSWQKLGGCGSYDNFTGDRLVINNAVTSGDGGTYVCTADNGVSSPVTQTFHVHVNGTGHDLCTFDSGSLCGWTQEKSDQRDLSLFSGPTMTPDTGPSNDHTLNNAKGKYLYLEASSPSKVGDTASIRSHMMKGNQSACFRFFYHMHGIGIGNLEVFVEDSCTHKQTKLWNLNGQQGTTWLPGSINIPASSVAKDYYIVVRTDVGPSYQGDIAIDDLLIDDKSCINCDFESGLCDWTQSKTDDFDWRRLKGPTLTTATGPSGDHTLNGKGYYMYTESSSKTNGDTAELLSPLLPAGHDYCLSLATSVRGRGMGTINIYISPPSGGNKIRLYSRHGDFTSPQWQMSNINIPAQTSAFNIVIEGVVGNAPLPADVDCTFEVDMCGWQQSATDDFDWTRLKGATTSSGTGPDSDHTSGHGYYIYTEATSPQDAGDRAMLISPTLPSGQDLCLQLYTNMYGNTMGQIDIERKSSSGTSMLAQYTTADSSAIWRERNIDIPAQTSAFTIQITGTIGSSYKSDAAIDDVTIKRGKC